MKKKNRDLMNIISLVIISFIIGRIIFERYPCLFAENLQIIGAMGWGLIATRLALDIWDNSKMQGRWKDEC